MRALWVLALVAACEQHTPSPVHHAEPPPPPPPPSDGGISVSPIPPIDAVPYVHGAKYCPGVKAWPAGSKTCITDDDCGRDGRCYPQGVPDYSGMCGMAPREVEECSRDKDCGKGQFCDHTVNEHHGCGEVIQSKCVTACTKDSCKKGEVCRPSGRCEIVQCTEGYACEHGWTCDKAGYSHDEHGCRVPGCAVTGCGPDLVCGGDYCVPKKCGKQSDCDCGACMAGQCSGRPGVCGPHDEPQPPP
jgi:hypothetical protein